jgi:hypothetical protein
MSRSANGLFAVLLVVWTWFWLNFWQGVGWVSAPSRRRFSAEVACSGLRV